MDNLPNYLTIIVTTVYTVVTYYTFRANKQMVAAMKAQLDANILSGNLSPIAEVERTLGTLPDAMRFHGISQTDLDAAGVTSQEFAYLVTSFTVGGIYHRAVHPTATEPFPKDSYRYHMCASEDTRRAWPLIKRMLNPSNFRDRIDKTIALMTLTNAH